MGVLYRGPALSPEIPGTPKNLLCFQKEDPKEKMCREKTSIIRSAGVVGGFTILSRILGYVRDRLIAYLLGTSLMADAFYFIFRLPNTFRRWMGEGALTAAVVPVFTDLHENKGKEEAWRLADKVFYALAVVLFILAALGVYFSAELLSFTGFSKIAGEGTMGEAVLLNRLIFPYVFFICLAALCMALLNSVRIFGPSSLHRCS